MLRLGSSWVLLYFHLCDAPVDFHRRFLPHLISDMGVSVQGGRTGYMAKDGGQRLDVHPVGQSIGCESMPEIMEPYRFTPRMIQYPAKPLTGHMWKDWQIVLLG